MALLILFFIARPILKRWLNAEKERKAAIAAGTNVPADLMMQNRSLPNPASASGGGSAVQHDGGPVTIDMIQSAPSYQERALLTQNFVRQNPDHAALVVKELLKEKNELEDADG